MQQYKRSDIHNHSRYSNLRLRDALPKPKDLIDRAIELGLSGIALTDHEALSGHVKANQYAQEIREKYPDFKVMLGNEIYLVDKRPSDTHYHFILVAKDIVGHRQLRILSTLAWLNGYSAKGLYRVDTLKSELEEVIRSNPGHIIASTACIGSELGQCILALTEAEKAQNEQDKEYWHNRIVSYILWLKDLFGEDFYIEAQPGVSKEQLIVNRRMVSIAHCFNVKMIPTSDTHYLKKEDRLVHKAYLNSENKEREVDAFYQDTFLHSNEEMIEKFALSGYDELFVQEMFKNSMEIYNKVEFYSLAHSQQVPTVEVPFVDKKLPPAFLKDYEKLQEMYQSDDKVNRYWINTCIDKLQELNKLNADYLNELEEEAEVKYIVGERLHTNMFSYPITLAHYINKIWECGSTVGAGRGSACAALNHYLLGITQLDPIVWGFPFFRYMNQDTTELGDIDIDVAPSKVQTIVSQIRKERGENFDKSITNQLIRDSLGAVYVCTFGTESTKSAIQTACRGYRSEEYPDGIDVDTSQYLSSLIPSERGFVWSINDVIYGNKTKGRKPVQTFINEVNRYPGLLEIIKGIDGCISRRGRHASGVIFANSDPFEFTAYMKTPSGEIITQYDLHDLEYCGGVKFDILVTSVQDKLIQTIELMQDNGVIEPELSLREAYNKYLHPDVLPINSDKCTWNTIQNAASLDLFQFDSDIGRQGAKRVKPQNMQELSATNGLIRLMTTEQGAETWLDKFCRYKADHKEFERDTAKYHLTEQDKIALGEYLNSTYGIGISQEQMMRVLMDTRICGFSLKEANAARRVISKKKMDKIPALKEQIFATAKHEGLAQYIWDFVVGPGTGYAFSDIHSTSYSFIGFQTAYLATHWNPIFWNTACLIVNSGSLESNLAANEKENGTDYIKLAKAIGAIRSSGIAVSLVDINHSDYGFKPDVKNNIIRFGLKGLNSVNMDVIDEIIHHRPYTGIVDFMNRCPMKKTVMISLIKSGAFDELDEHWAKVVNPEPRYAIMGYYILKISEPKKRLTMQNFNGLIQKNLLPQDLNFEIRVFNFNRYLKAYCKKGSYFIFDDSCMKFYSEFFDMDKINVINGINCINQNTWKKIYDSAMAKAKEWLKEHQEETLAAMNEVLFAECWNKYATGNISSWEMDSLCFYYHPHELINVDKNKYGIVDFDNLSPQSDVDYYFKRNGREIPVYKIYRIIGTVIGKNDTRSSISLLTTSGVVNVKFTKEYYAMANRQISQVNPDGTKSIIEKSWFRRGSRILVAGYRRDDTFTAKTYSKTIGHQLYLITNVKGKDIELKYGRAGQEEDEG